MDSNYDLEKILPHKRPMILIDDILEYSIEEGWLKSTVKINENSLFFDKKLRGISSIVGIEYMAQTIGCYAFFKSKLSEPHIGFLLGTRLYNNKSELFKENEELEILVKETFFVDNIVSFDCFIYKQGEEVASATINVYQDENIEKEL